MIEFVDINKNFGEYHIIKNLSMKIEKGKITVIIGSSGCGKTTTLKMINKLIIPTSGKIYIDGEDISQKDTIKLRRNIGYVIQQTGLFPHMTVKENIELIAKIENIDKNKMNMRTRELMKMINLDYEKFSERYPLELSGGQQQRVGVARAFALDPAIILMDEPFSAVDPISRRQLQDELVAIQKKLEKTIVFVTHDIQEAVKIADKICLLNNGEIMQYDTPENIIKNPKNDFVRKFVNG
ncbi:ABC transporter ATP-binding protein [Fusobacterium ulcerans]|uniref:Glycine betaine/L-proline transport ATP-binding protein ProV n=1 Tax=Fusobacterium ulcerans TaxID=861 RepID=A0AAX2JDL0_9FUSO|nr:ABC transporter ATP-binding protein [Fusobacterium ulcerans]AVQ27284.1 ABC transporter ATP-binding protein [Fusobacterium ulcerans]EFS24587.1 glycine betaine/L-proline transport ATP binding subunit [Fusobacterium ulcerans ATCC 49185]SQJ11890.1 Glycine betaine/L-proline transport ATP-binding protein ProV [Fusobacterium ulcerans]